MDRKNQGGEEKIFPIDSPPIGTEVSWHPDQMRDPINFFCISNNPPARAKKLRSPRNLPGFPLHA